MPKYWGKQIFSLGSFPEVGPKAKDGEKRERERLFLHLPHPFSSFLQIYQGF